MSLTVTVIIPVYNGEKLIGRCLKSIANQTVKPDEVIVIDDGSSDNTSYKVEKIFSESIFSGIRTKLYKKKNEGVARARNEGILLATSDYITFLDHDDFVAKNYLEDYIKVIEQHDYDMVIGGFLRCNEKYKVTRRAIPLEYAYSPLAFTYSMGRLVKRNFLIENNIRFTEISIGEDAYFNMVAYSYTEKIGILSKALYVWYENPKSVTGRQFQKQKKLTDHTIVFDMILNDMCAENHIRKSFLEYYFIKFTVWFLLYSAGKCENDELFKTRDHMFGWLNKSFPGFEKNKNISVFKPNGELRFNKICVYIYMKLKKMHLDKHVLWMIGKTRRYDD